MHVSSPCRQLLILTLYFAAETLVQMREDLKSAIEVLTKTDRGLVTAISSGSELFLRFITLTALDNPVGNQSSAAFAITFVLERMLDA